MTTDRDRLTVLYDAECDVCRLTIRALRRLDWRRRLAFSPLQRFEPGAFDPSRPDLLDALHVRDGRGRWERGGNAMLRIASVIPLLLPLSLVGRLPGIHYLVEIAYGHVADNRPAISWALDRFADVRRRHQT
jgi:predicted DCC family thiol-disulfide oxidoreductase YuxK